MSGYLKIIPQMNEHDDACITGNPEALTDLRNAIDNALNREEHAATSEAFQSDGEGYNVYVIRNDDARTEPAEYFKDRDL